MGTCCCGNKPSEQFIGTWTDNQYVILTINENGNIDYQKQTEHTKVSLTGPSRFEDDKLLFCCCGCCFLRGVCIDQEGPAPKLVANGIVLTKKYNTV